MSTDVAHLKIAEFALWTTLWGNPDNIDHNVYVAKRYRRIAAPYLEQLDETLDAGAHSNARAPTSEARATSMPPGL